MSCFMGEVVGGGTFSGRIFLEKSSVCFLEILQRYSWYYSGNHTKNNMACCFHFGRLFWVILGPIFFCYTVLFVLRNIPLMFCTDLLVTKEKIVWGSLKCGHIAIYIYIYTYIYIYICLSKYYYLHENWFILICVFIYKVPNWTN